MNSPTFPIRLVSFFRHPLRLAALAGFAALASGCVATVEAEPAYAGGVVVYDGPVYAFETYPRYWYNGDYVYLVGDRWYYRSGGGWVYYREEPPGLFRYRSTYYAHYGYHAPPRYGAPPAYRGRYVPPRAYGRAPMAAPRSTYAAPRSVPGRPMMQERGTYGSRPAPRASGAYRGGRGRPGRH